MGKDQEWDISEYKEYLKTGKIPVKNTTAIELSGERELKLIIHGFKHKDNKNGDPIPKQSDRNYVRRDRNGNVITFYNRKTCRIDVIQIHYQTPVIEDTTRNYVNQIVSQMPLGWSAFTNNVVVESCMFIFTPLKGFSKRKLKSIEEGDFIPKTTKPDTDNLFKLIGDCLEKAGVYKNDSLIWKKKNIEKVYGTVPCILIHLKGE